MKELSREKRQKEEELALTKQKNESLEKHMQAAMDGRLRDNLSELADAKAENEALRQQIEDLREENRALKASKLAFILLPVLLLLSDD